MPLNSLPDHHFPRRSLRAPLTMLIAIALLASHLTISPRTFAQSGPGDADPALYAPVVESQRDGVIAETAGQVTRYRVDAVFTPAIDDRLATITGTIDLRVVNITEDDLTDLPFRLYPNNTEYADGGISIDRAVSDDAELEIGLSVEETVAHVALPEAVPAGAAADLTIEFTTIIPTDPIGSYGMFSYDEQTGSYALAHWLPLIAGYDPANGWELAPLSEHGDPVFTNTALFDVSLTLQEAFVVVTTGSEVETSPVDNGELTRRFMSGPVRDFVMAIDDDYQVEQIVVGETTVSSYFNPDSAERGAEVLTGGAQSLELFNELLGAYPYAELDLVQIDLGNGAGGVEFPQLMFIGGDYYSEGAAARTPPGFLEFIVAHEVAHQWFYALVGNNQYQHAFTDEGISNFLTVVYFVETYGAEAGETQVNYNLKASYFSVLFDDGDQVVDQPTDDFPSQRSYGATIYGKAALGFGELRDAIGDEAFFAALRDYIAEFRFEVAQPEDLLAAFDSAADVEIGELWRHWFEAAEGRDDYDAADLAILLRAIGR
ncbi:MAG: M1 family metallopeptidase [Thermomicrobiales bacterium]|nr:M1 family metallopeptidase [Thermomicrobiales bacterium]